MDTSRSERLVWLFYNDYTIKSASELAQRAGVFVKDVYSTLRKEGYTYIEVDTRYYESSILRGLGIKNVKRAPKCIDCQMILVEDWQEFPDGWYADINGRMGDICAACFNEMSNKDKERFEKLVDIGCIVCLLEYGAYTAPEIHHIRRHGEYREHQKTIPLCPEHHRTGGHGTARHAGKKEWETRHGTEEILLDLINKVLKDKESWYVPL